ncbi:hypothetical protein MPSEU_000585400 [Mayamaea pseudoterrestris]|nr:hypothetical protein MPSEU_000585400 [Mayamaea pseudoterrestris]
MSKQLSPIVDAFASLYSKGNGSQPHEKQSLLLVAAAAASLVPLVYYYSYSRSRKQYPPGPSGLPLLGNLLDIPEESMDSKFLEWSMDHGLVYSIKLLGLGTWVIISDPDLVQRIFVSKNFEKSSMYDLFTAAIGSESLLVVDKEKWLPKRKAFSPGFSPKYLKDMVETMIDKLERFEKCIDSDIASDKETNMLRRSQTFTSDVIVAIAFGEDWGGDVNTEHPARDWNNKIAHLIDDTFTDPFKMFRISANRQIKHYERLIDNEMMQILERRLANPVTGTKKDICSIAVDEMRRDGGPLTYDDKVSISHQLKTFYFAGHDTTASTISWAIWLLAQRQDVLDKVREELKEHGIWTDSSKRPTYEDLQKCAYLEAVVKETLRLYPPASGISRATDDSSEEWNGYRLSGAYLVLSTYTMGRHPLLWKDPEVFRPERFLDGSEEPPNSKYSISVKFTAFSKGPRDCIGKYFALIESKLAISALAAWYDFDCVDRNERLRVLITSLPANGAAVRFRHRNASQS